MKTKLSTVFGMIFATAFISNSSFGQSPDAKPWVVPAEYKSMANPVPSNPDNLTLGAELFAKNCKSCHGTKGKGDGPKAANLETTCGDFTTPQFQSQTDGEIYYKMKEGRDDMPTFKKKIADEEDFWQMVNYIRTLKE